MPGGSQIPRGNVLLKTMLYLPSVTVPNVNLLLDQHDRLKRYQ